MTGAKKILVVLAVCSWVGVVVAQVTTGTISGTVTDSTGAVLPGATVVVLNEETGVSRTVAADAEGWYSAPSLNVGRYRITASLAGFQAEARSGIVLTVGRQAVVDFQLQVGAVTETVEVTGEAPLVETRQSTVQALVDSNTISELPLNGRDLAQLVLLQPGVTQTEQASTATHRGYGTQINISGARSDENVFLLDGTDIADFRNSAPVGPNGILFGVGSVREFQVQTSNFSAQYGRSLGGVFNAVSKSGTNTFHGEVFEFLRNNAVDARSFFDVGDTPPFRRNQFGGGLGGPIVQDKAFFHGAYEGLRSTRSTTARPSVPGPDLRQGIMLGGRQVQIDPLTASIIPLWPLPTPGGRQFSDGTAEFIIETPLTVRSDYAQGRLDYQLSDSDSIFGRLTFLDLRQEDVSSTPGYSTVTENGSWFATISDTHIFSPQLLNTVRFAFNRNRMEEEQVTPDIPQLKFFPDSAWPGNFSVTGIGMSFSLGLFPIFAGINNRFEVIDDVMLNRGNHTLQFGANFQRLQVHHVFPNIPQGQYSFRSIEGFLLNQTRDLGQFRGTPASLTDWVRGMRYWYLSGYIQDDWRVRPNLTLNLGLRYDFQSVPTEVNGKISNFRQIVPGGDLAVDGVYVIGDPLWLNPTTKDFAPRVGFAWTPWAERSTTIRGGFGLFYGRLDFRFYSPNRDGFIAKSFAVSTPSHFPNGLAELAASQTHQVDNVIFDSLSTPHTLQWSLDVQQQLGESMVLGVGYTGTRGLNLASVGNFNAPPTEFVDGVLTIPAGAGPRNPNLESFQTISTNTDSWYNALRIGLNRKMAAGLQFQLAYTWSKAISVAEQITRAALVSNRTPGHVLDVGHLDADKSLSPWDSRNVFKFNYIYELPWGPGKTWLRDGLAAQILGGWQLGGILTLKSGSPFTYQVSTSRALAAATVVSQRPNAKADVPVSGRILGTPSDTCDGQPCLRYYDPDSFSFPSARQLGNLGRNTGITPGIATFDASLQKSFSITERMKLQFRAEGFNLFNRVNFGLPNRTVFGTTGRPLGSTGVISGTSVNSREFQFGLKLTF